MASQPAATQHGSNKNQEWLAGWVPDDDGRRHCPPR
jgi:hypothetical protein